jgi:hypothetical protein
MSTKAPVHSLISSFATRKHFDQLATHTTCHLATLLDPLPIAFHQALCCLISCWSQLQTHKGVWLTHISDDLYMGQSQPTILSSILLICNPGATWPFGFPFPTIQTSPRLSSHTISRLTSRLDLRVIHRLHPRGLEQVSKSIIGYLHLQLPQAHSNPVCGQSSLKAQAWFRNHLLVDRPRRAILCSTSLVSSSISCRAVS